MPRRVCSTSTRIAPTIAPCSRSLGAKARWPTRSCGSLAWRSAGSTWCRARGAIRPGRARTRTSARSTWCRSSIWTRQHAGRRAPRRSSSAIASAASSAFPCSCMASWRVIDRTARARSCGGAASRGSASAWPQPRARPAPPARLDRTSDRRPCTPRAGATLVAAREPLVAFNVQLAAPATVADARRVAALIREGGEQGLPGLRAIGVELDGGVAQVSINVERPLALPLVEIVQAVARHAPPASAELVGLAPRAALEGFPENLPMPGFDPARHVIENALGSLAMAQTRRKRQTKHRGNAAAWSSRAGAPGASRRPRRRAATRRKATRAKQKRTDPRDRPPTWRGLLPRRCSPRACCAAVGPDTQSQARPDGGVLRGRPDRVHADQLLQRQLDLQPPPAQQGEEERASGVAMSDAGGDRRR